MAKIPFWTYPSKVEDFKPRRDEGWHHLSEQEQRYQDHLSQMEAAVDENSVLTALTFNAVKILGVLFVVVVGPYAIVSGILKVVEFFKP